MKKFNLNTSILDDIISSARVDKTGLVYTASSLPDSNEDYKTLIFVKDKRRLKVLKIFF